MKVFIDTNIFLEILCRREQFVDDALQYFSAVQAGADCLITRNIKDFGFANMEVLDSSTFLAKYNNVEP